MFTKENIARLMNKAMDDFIANPSGFPAEHETIEKFKADRAAGREPEYGKSWADWMESEKHGQS